MSEQAGEENHTPGEECADMERALNLFFFRRRRAAPRRASPGGLQGREHAEGQPGHVQEWACGAMDMAPDEEHAHPGLQAVYP